MAPRPDSKSEPVSRRLTRTLIHPDRQALIQTILFDPEGKWIAGIGFLSGGIAIWDLATGKERGTIPAIPADYHTSANVLSLLADGRTVCRPIGRTRSVRITKEGHPVVRWEVDGEIQLWDLATARPLPPLRHTPPRAPRGVALSPDGNHLAAIEQNLAADKGGRPKSMLTLWDTRTRTSRDLAESRDVPCFCPDGKTLAASFERYENKRDALALWDIASGKRRIVLHAAAVRGYYGKAYYSIPAFSPDGRYLAVNLTTDEGQRSQVKIWEVATGKEIASFDTPAPSAFRPLAFSPDSRRLAVAAFESKIFLYDVPARKMVWIRDVGKQVILRDPVFSPDGKRLAVPGRQIPAGVRNELLKNPLELPQSRLFLFDLASADELEEVVAPHGFQGWAAFSPNSRTLALGGNACIWLFDMTKKPDSQE